LEVMVLVPSIIGRVENFAKANAFDFRLPHSRHRLPRRGCSYKVHSRYLIRWAALLVTRPEEGIWVVSDLLLIARGRS
jgi:hypothetical protein